MTLHPWKAGGGSIAQFIFVNSECLFARISDADVPALYVGTSWALPAIVFQVQLDGKAELGAASF